jgi:hypothetical protein
MLRQLIDNFLLSRTEMLFEVEDQYGIHVEDVMKFQSMTLNEVVLYMEQIIRDKNGGKLPELSAVAKPTS